MAKSRYVALLRAINVGGKHKLPMNALVDLCAACGGGEIQTYIQSGNVVFSASEIIAKALAPLLEKKIAAQFGFAVPVVIRSSTQLAQIVRNNPFLAQGGPEQMLHVSFLSTRPSAEAIGKLDRQRSPGDEFEVVGSEIYLYLPNGMGRSKLTNAYFDSKLATVSTARNWATVVKLLEMTRQ